MTRTDIATLACRIMAIAMIAKGVFSGSSFLGIALAEYGQGRLYENAMYGMVGIVGAAVWLGAGWFCWSQAEWLAVRMLDDDPTLVDGVGLTVDELLSTACTIIGLGALIASVRYLLEQLLPVVLGQEVFATAWSQDYWRAKIIAGGIQIAFSLWLVFGADGFAKVIRWLRVARTTPAADDEPRPPSAGSEGSPA